MIAPVKFKPRRAYPLHRLPYVGSQNYEPRYHGIGYWDVPLTGGYNGGWKTGRTLGQIALAHMAQEEFEADSGHLSYVASSWLERAHKATPQELDTLRGQVLGFMEVIGTWAHSAAVSNRAQLARLDKKALLKGANQGLGLAPFDTAKAS